jgi:hypothetical protein
MHQEGFGLVLPVRSALLPCCSFQLLLGLCSVYEFAQCQHYLYHFLLLGIRVLFPLYRPFKLSKLNVCLYMNPLYGLPTYYLQTPVLTFNVEIISLIIYVTCLDSLAISVCYSIKTNIKKTTAA